MVEFTAQIHFNDQKKNKKHPNQYHRILGLKHATYWGAAFCSAAHSKHRVTVSETYFEFHV